ncbi:MAG: hypothetical protein KZQ99_14710 [Candidatus Thiodiazotropha sp. (ex Dulcina madagascariensis)]|nr:hypothetical protein [Candidatus Thiodiazotropha sp. (ex Dulcina madagascariensis)]
MKRRTVGILGLSGALLTPFWVGANEVAVSGRLGSLGIGVEGTFGLSQRFNARLGVNRFDFEISETIDDIEYDLDKEEQSFEDDIKLYRYYPVFSFGVSYRF